MKSLLEQVKELDRIIRQLQKLSSRMKVGQVVDAHRECNNLIGGLMRNREDIINEASGEENAD